MESEETPAAGAAVSETKGACGAGDSAGWRAGDGESRGTGADREAAFKEPDGSRETPPARRDRFETPPAGQARGELGPRRCGS
jgi:hypothetical protein